LDSKCVLNNVCFDDQSCSDPVAGPGLSSYHCDNQVWRDMDAVQAWCTNCLGAGMWLTPPQFAPGAEAQCCEDDPGEIYMTKDCNTGCVDDPTEIGCCDDPLDCVANDFCTDTTFCDDMGGEGINYCLNNLWQDSDDLQIYCDQCMGVGHWGLGGDPPLDAECCEDDPVGEVIVWESDSRIWDLTDDSVCCVNVNHCAHADHCHNAGARKNLGEPEGGVGGPITGDIEECNATSGNWMDFDQDQARCLIAVETDNTTLVNGQCLFQPGGSCWMAEGEGVNFAGYNESGSPSYKQMGCCGDDTGSEFYRVTNTRNDACCDDNTDFVHTDGRCEPIGNLLRVNGKIMLQDENGTYFPGVNIPVEIRWSNGTLVNYNLTNISGKYDISIPCGYTMFIRVDAPRYDSPTRLINFQCAFQPKYEKNYTLNFTTACNTDCTKIDQWGETRCDADCQDLAGCNYSTLVSPITGLTPRIMCDGKRKDWPVLFNGTHNMMCCKGNLTRKLDNNPAVIEADSNVKNAHTFYAGSVNYLENGELYGVYVILYDIDD